MRFGERYDLQKMLGFGGFGKVFRAWDRVLETKVALKILDPRMARDPEQLARFKREVLIARRISHRNVCKIFDLGLVGKMTYLSMEYIDGEDLSDIVKRLGALKPRLGLKICYQICQGLEAAHQERVVHRDLKPQNVMIDVKGTVKLMDFGVSRAADMGGLTTTGTLLGTPNFMSPEQCKGEESDHRSDLYSLGVLMYFLFTDAYPFKANTPMGVLYMHVEKLPRPPVELAPDLPLALNAVILRCLKKNPEDRYLSAAEIGAELERILKSESIPQGSAGGTASMAAKPASASGAHGGHRASEAREETLDRSLAAMIKARVPTSSGGPTDAGPEDDTLPVSSVSREQRTRRKTLSRVSRSSTPELSFLKRGARETPASEPCRPENVTNGDPDSGEEAGKPAQNPAPSPTESHRPERLPSPADISIQPPPRPARLRWVAGLVVILLGGGLAGLYLQEGEGFSSLASFFRPRPEVSEKEIVQGLVAQMLETAAQLSEAGQIEAGPEGGAAALYQKIELLDPGNPVARSLLATIVQGYRTQAASALEQGNAHEALRWSQEAMKHAPADELARKIFDMALEQIVSQTGETKARVEQARQLLALRQPEKAMEVLKPVAGAHDSGGETALLLKRARKMLQELRRQARESKLREIQRRSAAKRALASGTSAPGNSRGSWYRRQEPTPSPRPQASPTAEGKSTPPPTAERRNGGWWRGGNQ